jgi:tetratricopeptide (TPR) repeat protein
LGEQAVEVARRIGDERTLVFALEAHFIAVEGPDTVGPGLDLGARLIALGEQTGDKERVFAGLDHRLKTFWQLGDRAGVDVELARMRTVAGELRQPVQRWHVGTGETMVALMEGRFDEAEERITATRALGERATTWNAVVTERLALFVLRREQGRLAELEDALKRSMHEYPALLRFRCALAHLYAELGREAEARAMLAPLLASNLAHEHVDAEWAFSMTVLAEPCALVADQSAMAKLYAVLAPYERLYAQAPVEAVFGSVARGLGVLATALRRFEDAERHFGVALDVEGEMRAVPWLAHARHGLAAMLLARDAPGDGDRAQALLTDAVATYRDLAMEAWVDRAARLAPTAKGPAAGPLRG